MSRRCDSRWHVGQRLAGRHNGYAGRKVEVFGPAANEAGAGRHSPGDSEHLGRRIDAKDVISVLQQMARQDAAAASEIDDQAGADARTPEMANNRRPGAAREVAVRLVMDPGEIESVVVQS